MKKTLLRTTLLLLLSTAVVFSCKKKKDDATPDDTAEQTTNGNDDARVQSESDAAVSDADYALTGNSSTMRTSATDAYTNYYCSAGLTIDATNASVGKIVLHYDSVTVCNGRTRSGSITLQLANPSVKWSTAGSIVYITFNNYRVVRTSDGKSITFSGVKSVEHVSGPSVVSLTVGGTPAVHQIKAHALQVTFDDGTSRTWGIARTRSITEPSAGVYAVSTTGDSTVSGVGGVAAAGTTRLGSPFYSAIGTAVVWNTSCPYAPVSGVRTIKGISRELTITYGVDSNGNIVTSGCPSALKLAWTGLAGNSRTAILLY